jgi:hypothetical protein
VVYTSSFLFVYIISLVYSRYANCKNRLVLDYILSGVWSLTDWREYGISQQSSYAALHNPGLPFPQGGEGGGSQHSAGLPLPGRRGTADFSNVYPKIHHSKTKFVVNDPKRIEPNLTPKSQTYILEKEITNS